MSRQKFFSQAEIEKAERHNNHIRSERKKSVIHYLQIAFVLFLVADALALIFLPISYWEYMNQPAFIFFCKYGGAATGSWMLRKFLDH
jgi:hypothetical protein